MSGLVLSLFPGIDILGRGFEEEGYCVVRGPDPLWGGDIRAFNPPAGVFEGVIGGPPCPSHSRLRHQIAASGNSPALDLVEEFARCVREASPNWWVMENSPKCPDPRVCRSWPSHQLILNNRSLGEKQNRERVFYSSHALHVAGVALEADEWEHAVTADSRPVPVAIGGSGKRKPGADLPTRSLGDSLELQGMPPDWLDHQPWTMQAKRQMVGNAVPRAMAVAVARAVRKATGETQ